MTSKGFRTKGTENPRELYSSSDRRPISGSTSASATLGPAPSRQQFMPRAGGLNRDQSCQPRKRHPSRNGLGKGPGCGSMNGVRSSSQREWRSGWLCLWLAIWHLLTPLCPASMHRPDWAVTGAVTEAVRPEINAMPDQLNRALAVTPYLFGGRHGVMTDPTGLVHMRARYYHPGLRRFVNPDPIGFAGGMNWYGYAAGSPVMMVDPTGLVEAWQNPDGTTNWPTYIWMGVQGVPAYLKENGWSSFKHNLTDPKFIMENVGGGFGVAGAIHRATQTTSRAATATTGISVAVGEDMSSAAGTTVWRQVAEGHATIDAARSGIALPRGATNDALGFAERAAAHDWGTTAGSGMTSWTADLRFAQMRQSQSGGVILQSIAPEGSVWMNQSGVAFGSVEAQILISGVTRGHIVSGGQNVLRGLGIFGGASMFGNAVGQGVGRK